MKNRVIAICVFFATSLLMAGGDFSPRLSKVSGIPAKVCQENRVYLEKDVDLMWQDQAYTDMEDGAFKREHSRGKAGSQRYAAKYCSRLNYAGYADWRLPTADELAHVHDKDGQVFSYFRDNDFWTSTPTAHQRYYVIFPADGMRYARSQRQSNYIRCVRCMAE